VVASGGEIYRTNDGGDSWSLQYTSGYYFRSVGFADSQVGFAGTLDEVLLKTEDGGQSWIDVTDELPIIPSGICGMQWLDEDTFLAVGAWFGPAFLLRSDDRGANWTALDLSVHADKLVDLHFVSRDTGFVCGSSPSGGCILYTADGGEHWEPLYSTDNPGDYVWKLQFIDDEHAVASVQTFGDGVMPYTEDGGISWADKFVPYGDAQGIGFVTPQKGWIGGYGWGLYATEDGGDSWVDFPFGGNFNRFQVIDSTLVYASGRQIYKYADTTAVVNQIPVHIGQTFDPGLRVAPNPSAGAAVVTFRLPRANNVDLNLYDQRGALLQNIFNGRLPAGEHKIPVNPAQRNGYYLIGLQLNEGIYTEPFVVH